MFAVYASEASPDDPLASLVVGERPAPVPQPGWIPVTVRAASLNMHDIWTLPRRRHRAGTLPHDPRV